MRLFTKPILLLTTTMLLASTPASAALLLQLDGSTIYTLQGNFYTYYGTIDGAPGVVGFGIEAQATNGTFFAPTDPEHYGLVISADFADEVMPGIVVTYNSPYAGGVPDAQVADPGTVTGQSEWALSYSNNGVDPIPNPFHSVLFGDVQPVLASIGSAPGNALFFRDDLGNDGPGGIADRLDLDLLLSGDGIYHSVNLATQTLADLSDFINDGMLNGNGGPGELRLVGSVFEQGIDPITGRNVWASVPEPATLALLGLALAGVAARRKR